jgi:hypothetical protein
MPISTRLQRVALTGCVLLASLLAGQQSGHAADEYTRRASAPTQPSLGDMATGKRDRLEFGSTDFKGWVRKDGEWYIEGDVNHLGLVCADYEMGVRFGAGAPGCGNVEWLSEVRYATRRKQCNGATVKHTGGATEPELAGLFGKITCAERVIRCSGNCK